MLAMCKNLAYFAQHFKKHKQFIIVPCLNQKNLMKKNSPALNLLYIIIALGYIVSLGSCKPVKNVVYFQNVQNDTNIPTFVDTNFELRIRKNDLLGITIISPDPITTPLFNGSQSISVGTGESVGTNSGTANGYLVDNDGNIEIYKLGTIRVEGLTRKQLKQRLQRDLAPYLKDAVVTVRFLNNKVSVLGEVTKPQVINIPNEQISLLEAIAQSGDLTFTGRRDNILVIRETPNGKQFKRINLIDSSLFNSPFYYLQPNDIVYVEPTEFKIKSTAQNAQVIGYVLSGLSIFITLLSLLIR